MAQRTSLASKRRSGFRHARSLITDVCEIAGDPSLVEDAREELAQVGVIAAVQRHDNAAIFDFLMDAVTYQGVSNAAAFSYLQAHGNASHGQIAGSLSHSAGCPKLRSWWHFERCGFRKDAFTCSEPRHIRRCALPRLPLRNGGLNQTAYGLFLFMRDVCGGDLVWWLDERLACADQPGSPRRGQFLAEAVIGPLRNVHGVSDKVLNMSISMLLLAGDPGRERWILAGADMIAIDTLVHAWLSRTGILKRLRSEHPYGPRCYGGDGCAKIIRRVARSIDATRFNPAFPKVFPRFVQHAIWQFGAQSGLAQCNAFTVPDGTKCRDRACPLFVVCDRVRQPRSESATA